LQQRGGIAILGVGHSFQGAFLGMVEILRFEAKATDGLDGTGETVAIGACAE